MKDLYLLTHSFKKARIHNQNIKYQSCHCPCGSNRCCYRISFTKPRYNSNVSDGDCLTQFCICCMDRKKVEQNFSPTNFNLILILIAI